MTISARQKEAAQQQLWHGNSSHANQVPCCPEVFTVLPYSGRQHTKNEMKPRFWASAKSSWGPWPDSQHSWKIAFRSAEPTSTLADEGSTRARTCGLYGNILARNTKNVVRNPAIPAYTAMHGLAMTCRVIELLTPKTLTQLLEETKAGALKHCFVRGSGHRQLLQRPPAGREHRRPNTHACEEFKPHQSEAPGVSAQLQLSAAPYKACVLPRPSRTFCCPL